MRWTNVGTGKLDYGGGDVYIRVRSPFEFHRLQSCAKEPWTIRWIETQLRPGEVLFDVGANIGAYSLVAAVAEPRARVVAFEPAFENYAALCHNIALNELGDRITPLPLALSEHTGIERLRYSALEAGAAAHALGQDGGHPVYVQPTMTHRLDELAERLDLPAPNHLKLDVDGSEAAVLAGAAGLISDGSLRTVMVELGGQPETEVVELLGEGGFGLSERYERAQIGAEPPPPYGLFVRR